VLIMRTYVGEVMEQESKEWSYLNCLKDAYIVLAQWLNKEMMGRSQKGFQETIFGFYPVI